VAVLLVTLPGLPMFGHGQVEGYREKYGMEYRRAYWDETADQGFIAHHERQIFPLLRRRQHFAEVTDFQLYDLQTGFGVDDHVFAYSNGPAGDRQLVVYNNSPHATRGSLHHAAPKAAPGREGEIGPGTTLAHELLGAHTDFAFVRFCDHRDGRHFLRPAEKLRQGLEIHLGPYQYQLLHAFEGLHDEDGSWARLYAQVGDAPLKDLDRALLRLRYDALWAGWQQLVAPQRLHALAGGLLGTPLTAAALSLAGELDEEVQALAARLLAYLAPDEAIATPPPLADDLTALAGLLPTTPALKERWSDARGEPGLSYPLLCWRLYEQLRLALPSALWPRLEAFGLGLAWEELEGGGLLPGEDRQLATLLIACARLAPPPALAPSPLAAILRDPAWQGLAGINRYQGTLWFGRERLTRLVAALALQAAHLAALAAPGSKSPLLRRIGARLDRRLAEAERCGYRLEEFLRADAGPPPGRLRPSPSTRPLRILMVTSEAAPLAKSGGLGDVLGSLPAALRARGHDVRVVLPYYRSVAQVAGELPRQAKTVAVPFGSECHPVHYCLAELDGVPVYCLDIPYLFDRPGLYGEGGSDYPDNARRFALFCRAALELARTMRFAPDVVHAHDWQAALAPVYLRHRLWHDPFFAATGSLLTIHNLGYQGFFPAGELAGLDLDPALYALDGLEFHGGISLLKGGIVFADRVSTVSPTYCREIQTPAFGVGLDGLLRARGDRLHGILNGLDGQRWDPAGDPALPARYSPADLAGKSVCKAALQQELGLQRDPGVALAAMVTRLDPQKGLDLLLAGWEQLLQRAVQLVILGSGHPGYEQRLVELAARAPGRVAVCIGFDDALARRIYAGSDLFLMPSGYEPCGLGQLIALRYGSVPLVHATGGLADTIRDPQRHPDTANGFVFHHFSGAALLDGLDRLLSVRGTAPERWQRLMAQGMAEDFSWRRSADDYLALYRTILEDMA